MEKRQSGPSAGHLLYAHISDRYSTFWRRFCAFVIDTVVWLPIVLLDPIISTRLNRGVPLVVWFIFVSFAYLAYSVLFHGFAGQTLGKMITGVQVVDLSEGKLSFRQAVLRDSVPLLFAGIRVSLDLPSVYQENYPAHVTHINVSTLLISLAMTAWLMIELITMLLNKKRRAVHDFIARSVVIRTR